MRTRQALSWVVVTVAAALLAGLVSLPLFHLGLVYLVDSISPTVDTARSFTAGAGGVLILLGALAALPLAAALARLRPRWATPVLITGVAAAGLASVSPAVVRGARRSSPPSDELFLLGAVGLTVGVTVLMAAGIAGMRGTRDRATST